MHLASFLLIIKLSFTMHNTVSYYETIILFWGGNTVECITFGESMVLFNPESNGPLKYVHGFSKSIGGAESNVAIALARLGHKVGWFSQLGDDEFGRYIKSVVGGEDVDVSRVHFDASAPTGIFFKERFANADPNVYYYRKHSAASKMTMDILDEDYIKQAKIFHVSGITPALSDTARLTVLRAIQIAKKHGVMISFDPNIRLKLWTIEEARPLLLEIASLSDIIFPGIDESFKLLGLTDPAEITTAFHEMGCATVALKLGKEGCYVSNQEGAAFIKGYTIDKPVDTVGAGDGFAAGFLSGILKGLPIEACADLANVIGAMATMVCGDMEGYPTEDQVLQFLGKSKTVDR